VEIRETTNRKRVAIVIGSGGVKCAAALGLWKVLKREGIELDMVVGCSGGSLYAAPMALGLDLDDCVRLTRQLWTPEVTRKRDWNSLLGAFLPKLFRFDGRFGMVDDREVERRLQAAFGDRSFEDASIPLHLVATDLINGERVVLSRGSIVDAIRASIAIPYVWKPWQVEGRWLLDGCLSDPLPVGVAMKEGADIILAMGFEAAYPKRIRSATRFAFQINSVYTNNLLRASFAFHNLAHHSEIIPILPEFEKEVRLFDTDLIPYVIEQGERVAEAQLPYIHRLLAAVPA
jgi:NTE family protein